MLRRNRADRQGGDGALGDCAGRDLAGRGGGHHAGRWIPGLQGAERLAGLTDVPALEGTGQQTVLFSWTCETQW